MKKFLAFLGVLILIVLWLWPDKVYRIESVIDGNTIQLEGGATVHLIGITSTNESKNLLENLCGKKLQLVPDKSSLFNPEYLDAFSSVYAYVVREDNDECINAIILKERYANIEETTYLKDSLVSFRAYANNSRQNKPEPTPNTTIIDYQKDKIFLDPYTPSEERKHSAWYTDGNLNLEMLEEACDFNLPYTKKFANELAARSPGNFSPHQICEIFSYCYKKWSYVNDPIDNEYVARASETINNSLIGDCDDFAVLMASCILAVGGRPCLNTGHNTSGGHAFTEVDISSFDEGEFLSVVREYFPSCDVQQLNYRLDSGRKWLNLDWQNAYPGGEYYDCSLERDSYPYENGGWTWKKLR